MDDDFLLIVATNMIGVMAVFALWGFSSIFLHELGHTLVAKLLGLNPRQMIVGECDPLFAGTVFGVQLVFRVVSFGGLTIVGAPLTNRLKARFWSSQVLSLMPSSFSAFSERGLTPP